MDDRVNFADVAQELVAQAFALARAAFAANDYAKARILAASALALMPGNKDLLLLQAKTLLALGDGAGAGAALQ
ncbi:MAG: hypothetical protein ACK56H_00890, partial [Novosphingobium sp.]